MISRGVVTVLGAAVLTSSCSPAGTWDEDVTQVEAEEFATSREAQLARAAEEAGIPLDDLPDVDLVRLITPEEYLDVYAGCITEQGFTPESRGGGGVSHAIEPGAELGFAIAKFTCYAMYPVDLRDVVPMDDARREMLYEHYVSTATPCIEDLGYEVSEPPSLEVYLAQSAQVRWDPYADVEQAFVQDALENDRWESFNDLYDACPPEPHGW